MSIVLPFRDARYMTSQCLPPGDDPPGTPGDPGLLRVELDDQLFLDLRVDMGPDRQPVDHDAHLVRDHLDDVVLADPVGRDVYLLAVHREVPVAYQLTGHVAALGEARAEHDVVQAALEQLEHGLARPAVLAGRLLVVDMELALEDAVDPLGLLLFADLLQVLAFLGPVPAVLTRRVGPDLD